MVEVAWLSSNCECTASLGNVTMMWSDNKGILMLCEHCSACGYSVVNVGLMCQFDCGMI